MNDIFKPLSIEDNHFLLASHLPQGRAFCNAFDPNDSFGLLFKSFAIEFQRFQFLEEHVSEEMDINKTDELSVEWEESVGLPDECFNTDINIVERRKQILAKFSKYGGVQKAEDFVRVAALFDIGIRVVSGKASGVFPLTFPSPFFDTLKTAVHTILVELLDIETTDVFPLPFPLPFDQGEKLFLQCLFDTIAPANVQVIILNKGEI